MTAAELAALIAELREHVWQGDEDARLAVRAADALEMWRKHMAACDENSAITDAYRLRLGQ